MPVLELMVIAFAALAFLVTIIVLNHYGSQSDKKQERLNFIKSGGSNEKNQDELNGGFFARTFGKLVSKFQLLFLNMVSKNNSNGNNSNGKTNRSAELLKRKLRLAGIFMDPQEFSIIKLLVTVGITLFSLLVAVIVNVDATIRFFIIAIGLVVGIEAPTFYLNSKIKSHQEGIRNQLPDVMDMIGICVEAGLSFDAALSKINEQMQGACVDEFMILYREIQMGKSRRDAINDLAAASDVDELKSFASALSQAETLGIPIKNVLTIQSQQLRLNRSIAAKEKGMKSSIKMLLPMIAFIFPALFIILMAPTVANVIAQLM